MHMDSFKNKRGTKTGWGFFIFTAVFVLIIMQFLGIKTIAYAAAVKPEVSVGKKEGKIADSKDKSIDKKNILAEVNGEAVTTGDLLRRYNLFFSMSRLPESYRGNVKISKYLDSYITELLLLQKARKMGIRVTPNEIAEQKKRYLEKTMLTDKALSNNLLKAGLTMKDADGYFKDNLLINTFGNKKFKVKEISDKEAREFYINNNKLFNSPEEITASQILICHRESQGCKSDLTPQQAKKLAEKIREVATPENFAMLAKKYSTDNTGANGGNLGVIVKGTAVPAFDKAAFSLEPGEISNVVKTIYGFHIIYVTGKQKARAITFEQAKESIKKDLREDSVAKKLLVYAYQLRKASDIKIHDVHGNETIKELESKLLSQEKSANGPVSPFKTFKDSGKPINRNAKGQPIILLFSESTCPHCQWIGPTFDNVVKGYVKKGLIEAHHYDVNTQDDLLTPNKRETKIPEKYLKIKEQGDPESLVPYFNFGGKYYRIGNGEYWEKRGDLYGEEVEMREVINALLKK